MKTHEFVQWLDELPDDGRVFSVLDVDLDPETFFELVERSPRVEIVASSDGPLSIVKEADDPNDHSKSSRSFDLHTDGCWRATPPRYVLLYCKSAGSAGVATYLADSERALAGLGDDLEILRGLDYVYVGKDLRRQPRPLVERHPVTGAEITNVSPRGYVSPVIPDASRIHVVPDLRVITAAMSRLYAALDEAVFHRQVWTEGQMLFFDNHTFLHGRAGGEVDLDRELYRIWLDPAVPAERARAETSELTAARR